VTEPHRALVFVVDDDPEVVRLVTRTLGEFDFATQAFRDGASVLRRLMTERPDLCIVDLGLPDMDGIELVREIARRCDCGMLILTGRGYTADRVMGLEGGGDDYVVKPFEPRELVARVRSILRRRGGRCASVAGRACSAAMPASATGPSTVPPTPCAARTDGEQVLGTAEAQVLRTFLERRTRSSRANS
jgi:two-component system OmpR family response regulator